MGNNGDMDRIINRSREIRERDRERREKDAARKPPAVKGPRPIGALRIWFINYSTPVIFMGVPMLLLVPMFFMAINSADKKTHVIGLWLGGIVGAMTLYLTVHFLRTFPAAYRAWHFRPDYPLRGMTGIFGSTGGSFWKDDAEQWINCAVTVKLKGEAPEAAEAFAAALTIFTAAANGAFYGASGSDKRKEWVQQGLRAAGSADGRVLFRMKKFLSGEMALVARHYPDALEAVEVTATGGSFTVSREGYSGDGTAS